MVYLRKRLALFLRNRRGRLPQREFARRTGLAQSTIMRIENQDQNVTLDTLEQLCRVFHAEVDELFPPLPVPRQYESDRSRAAAVHERNPPQRRPRVKRRRHDDTDN